MGRLREIKENLGFSRVVSGLTGQLSLVKWAVLDVQVAAGIREFGSVP